MQSKNGTLDATHLRNGRVKCTNEAHGSIPSESSLYVECAGERPLSFVRLLVRERSFRLRNET